MPCHTADYLSLVIGCRFGFNNRMTFLNGETRLACRIQSLTLGHSLLPTVAWNACDDVAETAHASHIEPCGSCSAVPLVASLHAAAASAAANLALLFRAC